MKIHFMFKDWEDDCVEVFRTFDNGTCFHSVTDAFAHFLSMAYGYPIKVTAESCLEEDTDNRQMELDLQ